MGASHFTNSADWISPSPLFFTRLCGGGGGHISMATTATTSIAIVKAAKAYTGFHSSHTRTMPEPDETPSHCSVDIRQVSTQEQTLWVIRAWRTENTGSAGMLYRAERGVGACGTAVVLFKNLVRFHASESTKVRAFILSPLSNPSLIPAGSLKWDSERPR